LDLTLDPFAFKPTKTSDGLLVEWGIQDVYDEFMTFNLRRLSTQTMYGQHGDSSDQVEHEPAVQFINALAYRKELEIFQTRESRNAAMKKHSVKVKGNIKVITSPDVPRDYVIDVSIRHVKPKIWRRIKLSSGVSLSILHDKILAPAFGWVRNYHAYAFTEQYQGAMFGPVVLE
jgi:hypothetical protein